MKKWIVEKEINGRLEIRVIRERNMVNKGAMISTTLTNVTRNYLQELLNEGKILSVEEQEDND